jgi:AraC family transcriptional regulator
MPGPASRDEQAGTALENDRCMNKRSIRNSRFLPRMQSDANGYRVVEDLKWKAWEDAVVDVWHVQCDANAHGTYVAPDPRLFVVIDITSGGCLELEAPAIEARVSHTKAWSMAYIPAGIPIRSRAVAVHRLKHMDIHLSETALTRKFGKALDRRNLDTARLLFDEPRMAAIAKLLAEECCANHRLDDHFGIGLVDALSTALFGVSSMTPQKRPSLSRNQLELSVDYIDAHCFETIRLHDLASLLGLSESYFSHAFKAATGVPPLRWQMETRIAKVKDFLVRESMSLTEIAASSGFSDQAHLTRSFKRLVGITPSDWRRNRSKS